MKIVFLCGCLEPGRDGVGDYTRRLTDELIKQGHLVSAIALNDRYIETLLKEDQSYINPSNTFVRLPFSWNSEKKFNFAKQWIQSFDPDWVSLQFVIYNYHPKGLSFGLSRLFKGLSSNIKFHIMFHELWIGISKFSPITHKINGYFQRRIISSIIKTSRPKVITTSNILYKMLLKTINVDSTILSLFSNIEVAPKNEAFVYDTLNKLGLKSESELINWEITGMFGQLHRDASLEPILTEQFLLCQQKKLKMAFISFGRIGHEGMVEFKRLEKALSPNIKFLSLGEQSPENISNLMQLLNVGISSTSLPFIGKSGVYAAMRLHNLKVIIREDDKLPEYISEIKKYQTEIENRIPEQWGVVKVTENFANLLMSAE
jgi:hypothetical protein